MQPNSQAIQEGEDEDYASFLDLFTGIFFLMLLLVLMLFLLMGDGKSQGEQKQAQLLANVTAERDGSRGEVERLQGELDVKDSTIAELQKRSSLADEKVAVLGGQLTELNGLRAKDTQTFRQWTEAQERWFAERKTLEQKLAELGGRLEIAEGEATKVGSLEIRLAEAKKVHENLQRELFESKEERTKHMDLFGQWDKAQDGWRLEKRVLEQTIAEITEKLKTAGERADKVTAMEVSLAEANRNMEVLQKELTGCKEELTKNMGLFAQWDNAQNSWFAERKKKDEEIASLKAGLTMMTLGAALTRDFGQRIELDASGFRSGGIEIPYNLEREIEAKLPGMEDAAKDRYNTIEIIGHTDGDPVTSRAITADDNELASAIVGQDDAVIGDLRFKSNMELGMARALAVYRVMASHRGRLPSIKYIRVYSAGQYTRNSNIDLSDYSGLTLDTPSRRKIEIRLTYTKG